MMNEEEQAVMDNIAELERQRRAEVRTVAALIEAPVEYEYKIEWEQQAFVPGGWARHRKFGSGEDMAECYHEVKTWNGVRNLRAYRRPVPRWQEYDIAGGLKTHDASGASSCCTGT